MHPRTLVLLGLAAIVFFVACCGGLAMFGFNMATEEVRQKLESDPRFTEHVGQVTKFKLEMGASFTDDDDDVYVYAVEGTIWSGRVTVKHVTDDDGDEQIIWARFTLPSGRQIELRPDEPPAEPAPKPQGQMRPPADFIKRGG